MILCIDCWVYCVYLVYRIKRLKCGGCMGVDNLVNICWCIIEIVWDVGINGIILFCDEVVILIINC